MVDKTLKRAYIQENYINFLKEIDQASILFEKKLGAFSQI